MVSAGDGYVLRMTSDQPINEAMINPIIELTDNGNTQMKSISLALSGYHPPAPEAPVAATTPVVPSPPAQGPAAASAMPPWPVPAIAPAPTPHPAPPKPLAPVVASPATVPKVVAAAKAAEVRSPASNVAPSTDDLDVIKGQLTEAKAKVEKLAELSERLSTLVTVQQQIIDKQAGIIPAPDAPSAAAAPLDPNGPLEAAEERSAIDPWKVLILLAGAVLAATLLSALLRVIRQRRGQRTLYLPAARVARN